MNTHITNLHGMSYTSTALMAQHLCTDIARYLGYRVLDIYFYPVETDTERELNTRMDGIMSGIENGDNIIFQYPSWNGREFDERFLDRLRQFGNIKITIFVHDIIALMFDTNYYVMPDEIRIFNKAESLILPSKSMHERLIQEGLNPEIPVVYQYMWDHLVRTELNCPVFKREINFAGNPDKFEFVKKWDYDSVSLKVYSENRQYPESNATYTGWLNDTMLMLELSKGGFGLVWDELPYWITYMQYSNPYKEGTYLAAGLPVIVRKGVSNEQLIRKNGLGIVVETLEEAVKYIERITEDEYNALVANVRRFSPLLQQGYFTKKALIDTQFAILSNGIE